VLQAFTPVITWTSFLGKYYFHFFPRTIRINHFMEAWRGESSVTSEVASEEDEIFVLVIAVMVFMWTLMLYCLDDTYKSLKKSMFCNAGTALCSPHRLHVHASTLVWVAVKLFILFGRPSGLCSSTMATHHTLQWPQIVMCMFFYDTLLNCMWACQLVVGNLAPVFAGKCCFKYYTQIVWEARDASTKQTQPEEFFVVEEKIETSYLSNWRDEAVVCNSLACTGIHIQQTEHKLILTDLFAEFSTATCEEASVYTRHEVHHFLVGRAHADSADNETRKKNESDKLHETLLASIQEARRSKNQHSMPTGRTDTPRSTPTHEMLPPSRIAPRKPQTMASLPRRVSVSRDTEDEILLSNFPRSTVTATRLDAPRTHLGLSRMSSRPPSPDPTSPDPPLPRAPEARETFAKQLIRSVAFALWWFLRQFHGTTRVGTQ